MLNGIKLEDLQSREGFRAGWICNLIRKIIEDEKWKIRWWGGMVVLLFHPLFAHGFSTLASYKAYLLLGLCLTFWLLLLLFLWRKKIGVIQEYLYSSISLIVWLWNILRWHLMLKSHVFNISIYLTHQVTSYVL